MPSFQCPDCGRMHTDWSQCAKRLPVGKISGFGKCGLCGQMHGTFQLCPTPLPVPPPDLRISTQTEITCPKCGETSGDNWSQCEGSCPMPMSPHFDRLSATLKKNEERVRALKVSEAQAMERAVMLGFKIVVSPRLKGTETEIHVSQERYDELKRLIPEGKSDA